MILDKWQKEFLETQGDKILCIGRRSGKTFICAIDAGRYAVKNPNVNVLIVAPTERQASYLFEATSEYLYMNKKDMIKQKRDRPTKSLIKLKNGSRIYCLPIGISANNIRGLTVHRLYIDECSRVDDGAFAALTPMLLTTGGNQIYLSTPFGKKGEFYRCWINENNAYDSFTRFSKSSEEVMTEREVNELWTEARRQKAFAHLEREKARMSAREYMQEYEGKFVDDLLQWFPDELLRLRMTAKRQGTDISGRRLYLGVDIARMGKDDSCFEIVEMADRKRYVHIDSIITKKQKLNETYNKILELDRIYHFRKIFIDSGGIGVGVSDFLISTTGIGRRTVEINNRSRSIDTKDRKHVRILKEDLYSNMLVLLQRGEAELLDDEEVFQSLKSIQYEYVVKEGESPKLLIFSSTGNDHITEALNRAFWANHDTTLNLWAA